jgi:hypothetical protein
VRLAGVISVARYLVIGRDYSGDVMLAGSCHWFLLLLGCPLGCWSQITQQCMSHGSCCLFVMSRRLQCCWRVPVEILPERTSCDG